MIDAFPTPIYKYSVQQHPNAAVLNADLLSVLLEEEKQKTTTEAFSLKGRNGWHSTDDLCDRDTDWSRALRALVMELSNQYVQSIGGAAYADKDVQIKCWAMILREGDYSSVHTHPFADVCGCYYVQVPEDMAANEGHIVFLDPRGGARGSRMFGSGQIRVLPEVSGGVVFPNWLDHYVESHYTSGTRISIAWNFYVANAGSK